MIFNVYVRNALFLVLMLSCTLHAQMPVELEKKISVDFNDESFPDVLKEISKLTGTTFNYSRNNIPVDKKITYKAVNETAISVLETITKMTGTEIIISENGQVVITSKLKGSIRGSIHDKTNGFPLIGVNIILKNTLLGTSSDINGNFNIDNLPEGYYTILCSYLGYKNEVKDSVKITPGKEVIFNIEMEEESISLGEIVITPGSFGLMQKKPSVMQTLSKEDIRNMSFGEDVYRAVTRIPGLSSNDFSSKFIIRGGETDEILVNLDGMTLYEPFHLKDIHGGVLSIVDAAIIGEANILAGAFPAEYGDKMSGVFRIKSLEPAETKNMLSASISMLNARLMGQGSYDNQNGSWIVSARRGYLDFVLDKVKEDAALSPTYYDFYAKTDYRLSNSDRISANILYGGDIFDFDDEFDTTRTDYYNASAWTTYDRIWNRNINSQTVLYFNKYEHTRKGIGRNDDTAELEFRINDYRNFNIFGLKHNTHYDYSDGLLLKFGFEYSGASSEYDYLGNFRQLEVQQQDPEYMEWENRIVKLAPSGNKLSAYLSSRFKIADNFVTEIGGRYAQTSYTDDNLFSPRINAAWMLTPRTTFRAGYGYFYQTQDIQGIRVQNGENAFNNAELAVHYMAGVEHLFNNGLFFRVEAYYKELSNLKTAYRNISDFIVMFPEVYHNIIRIELDGAESKGLEFMLKYDKGGPFSFWASYALASSSETIKKAYNLNNEVVFSNTNVPRQFDQRNTVNLDLNFRPGNDWHINIAWQFRNGWPATAEYLGSETDADGNISYYKYYGGYQKSRLPDYHRLDLRISKYFSTSYGSINLFLEVMNLYNRKNIRAYSYKLRENDKGGYLERAQDEWLPIIPSIGIRWDLDF